MLLRILNILIFSVLFMPVMAIAQEIPDVSDEVAFGKYALPVILYVVLGLIYKILPSIPNRAKILIAVILGVTISLIAIQYSGKPWTTVNVVDHILYGLFAGTAAGGLYEGVNRAVFKPRT